MSEDFSLEATLAILKNRPAWEMHRTHGSMFFLEIGESRLKPGRKRAHGEWHFLIEMCHWRIETKDRLVTGSDDDQELIDKELSKLELGNIEEAHLLVPSYDVHLAFSSGVRLSLFSAISDAAKDEWTQWMLFCPDDNAWVLKAGSVPIRRSIHSTE